jgi:predicted DsbA family dithiol-disulfide isomerase
VLAAIGGDLGLDPEETQARLAGEDDRAEVTAEIENAYRIGVTGVPCFIIDRRYAVMGAEAPETIAEAIRRANGARQSATA